MVKKNNLMIIFVMIFLFLISVVNAAQIIPNNPDESVDLVCDAISVDSTTVYKWYKNSKLFSTSSDSKLSKSATFAGQEWHCEVWALHYIPYVGTTLAPKETSPRVVISSGLSEEPVEEVNPIITLLPNSPTTNQNLECNIDLDGNYIYRWYKNGRQYSGVSGSLLDNSKTLPGQEWNCEVYTMQHIPFVGNHLVSLGKSDFVLVTSPGPNSPLKPVLVSPISGIYVNTKRPTFEWDESVDPDGDDVSYQLYINDNLITTTQNTIYTIDFDLPEGYNVWKIKAVDEYGHESVFSDLGGFNVDSVPVNIFNFFPDNYYITQDEINFNFLTDKNSVCRIDGVLIDETDSTSHSHTLSTLVDGNLEVEFICEDKVGFTKNIIKNYLVDLTDPNIIDIQPENGSLFTVDEVLLQIETDENSVCKYSLNSDFIFEDGLSFETINNIQHFITVTGNVNPGLNIYYYLCRDDAGRLSQKKSSNFYVDNTPILINEFSPVSNYILFDEITLSFETNKNSICEINGIVFDNTDSTVHIHNLDSLSEGELEIDFYCESDSGTNVSFNKSYYVDLNDPVIINISPANNSKFNLDNVLVNITTSENSTCRYDYNSSFDFNNGINFDSSGELIHLVNISGNINPGFNTYYYLCQDDSGRISAKNTSTFYVDSFGPEIISFNYTNESYVLSNNFNLSIETDKNATCYYDFSSGVLFNSSTVMNYTGNLTLNTTVHNVSFENLNEGINEFYFKCKSYLEVNSSVEKFVLFVDTISPVITSFKPINDSKWTSNNVTLVLNVSENSYCSYSNSSGVFNFEGVSNNFTKNITLVDGDYTYSFNCTDLAGRTSLVNETNFSINTQIPVMYNFSNNVSLLTDFNVTFNTTSNATCYYSDNSNILFNSSSLMNSTNGFSHMQNFSLADGEYTYYFKCQDTFGLNSSVEEFSFAVDNLTLNITSILPDGILEEQNVTFILETNKDAICYYSNNSLNITNEFTNTSGVLHNTTLDLVDEDYTYYFQCQNIYGRNSSINSTDFTVNSLVPTITFISPVENKLNYNVVDINITTNKEVACEINNSDFIYGTGFEMSTLDNLSHTNTTLTLLEGNYEFKVICTDGYYEISENVTFEIDALKPNITIQNITFNVSEFYYSDLIQVNVTLNNSGEDNLTDILNLTVELNGVLKNLTINPNDLNVSNSTNYTFDFDLDFITAQNLTVFVDTKTNQENDLLNNTIIIEPFYADFTLSNFLVNETNQSTNENRTFNVTLENIGTLRVNNVNVSMFVNNVLFENKTINVENNSSQNLSFNWNSTTNSGVNEIKFVVNGLNEYTEWNYSNNELILNHTVYLPGEKDVEFRTLQIHSNSTEYWVGKQTELNFEVENIRNDSINNVETRFYVDGELNQTDFVDVLGNSIFNVTYQFIPNKTGTYNFTFEILNVTSFDDVNDNNLTQEIVVWEEVYDLEIGNLDYNLSSSTIYVGNKVRYFADLINNGNVSVDSVVRLRENGNQVGLDNYFVQNESNVSVSYDRVMDVEGFRTMRILADLIDNEIDITNNFKEVDVRVWALDEVISPDTKDIFVISSPVNVNNNITIYYPIQNFHNDLDFFDLDISLVLPAEFSTNNNSQKINLNAGNVELLEWNVNVGNVSGTYDILINIEGNTTFVNSNQVVVSE